MHIHLVPILVGIVFICQIHVLIKFSEEASERGSYFLLPQQNKTQFIHRTTKRKIENEKSPTGIVAHEFITTQSSTDIIDQKGPLIGKDENKTQFIHRTTKGKIENEKSPTDLVAHEVIKTQSNKNMIDRKGPLIGKDGNDNFSVDRALSARLQ